MSNNRDDFLQSVKDKLAKQVGYHCCNPFCYRQTIGPNYDKTDTMSIGVASHITAAAPGGKRYDSSLTSEQRKDYDNGIWMCQTCSKLIDSDEEYYTVEKLKEWKEKAENIQWKQINENGPDFIKIREIDITKLSNIYDKVCEILSCIDTIKRKIPEDMGFFSVNDNYSYFKRNANNDEVARKKIRRLEECKDDLYDLITINERIISDDLIYFCKKILGLIPDNLIEQEALFIKFNLRQMFKLGSNYMLILKYINTVKLECEGYSS